MRKKKKKLKRKETYKFNTKDNYRNSEDTVEYGKIVNMAGEYLEFAFFLNIHLYLGLGHFQIPVFS